ncbi:dTDP-glucose 4,6-dehydratase [candidate division WOR-3 bacterium]|nr:dTDP-glucose 4,6-dehydratase [candidate division WOR-3 bacterium]
MRVLVTGGCGFIGSNFVRHVFVSHPDWQIANLDALTYAGNRANLADLETDPRYRFVHGRIEDRATVEDAIAGCDAVVNFAAESHVDRSIHDATPFIRTNVVGTQVLLDAAVERKLARFIQLSTDEVYGTLGTEGLFTEKTPLEPRSPYAASKAAADMLARACWETHRLPVCVVRPSNNYGPWQYPEKLIPLMLTNLFEGGKVPVYGKGDNVRDWLYVEDNCRAICAVLERGRPGEAYNIGGNCEKRNIEVVRAVLGLLGLGEDRIEHVPDRPGHDFRYALDNRKIESELGWRPATGFEDGIKATLDWYRGHEDWWRELRARLERERRGFWTAR